MSDRVPFIYWHFFPPAYNAMEQAVLLSGVRGEVLEVVLLKINS